MSPTESVYVLSKSLNGIDLAQGFPNFPGKYVFYLEEVYRAYQKRKEKSCKFINALHLGCVHSIYFSDGVELAAYTLLH